MKRYVVKIDGMMCGMCEAHVSDVIRKNFNVKKVKASHIKKEAEIIAENEIDREQLAATVASQGYKVKEITEEEYVKRDLFSFLK